MLILEELLSLSVLEDHIKPCITCPSLDTLPVMEWLVLVQLDQDSFRPAYREVQSIQVHQV